MPLGWRPKDVEEKYPVYKIEDVHNFEKYRPQISPALQWWCWIQLVVILLLISYFFGNIVYINSLNPYYIYGYGLFIFFTVYAFTDLMDKNSSAIVFEIIKSLLGFYFLYSQQDWFGASKYFQLIVPVLGFYLILSPVMTAIFVRIHKKESICSALVHA